MATLTCPRCQEPTRCTYDGEWGGGMDYCDHYSLRCTRCDYTDHREETASDYSGDGLTLCPFCGRSNLEHPREVAAPPDFPSPSPPAVTPQSKLPA